MGKFIRGAEETVDGYGERAERAAENLAELGVKRPEDLSPEQLKDAISGGEIASFDALDLGELIYVRDATLNGVPLEEQTDFEEDKGDI